MSAKRRKMQALRGWNSCELKTIYCDKDSPSLSKNPTQRKRTQSKEFFDFVKCITKWIDLFYYQ